MRKRVLAVLLGLVVLSSTASVLSACHTTAGAGEDLSNAGTAIHNSAEKHTNY